MLKVHFILKDMYSKVLHEDMATDNEGVRLIVNVLPLNPEIVLVTVDFCEAIILFPLWFLTNTILSEESDWVS